MAQVAHRLKLLNARMWDNPVYLAKEVKRFMVLHAPVDQKHIMPTHKQLLANGFSGLLYALKKYGADDAARRLGLKTRSRGRSKACTSDTINDATDTK